MATQTSPPQIEEAAALRRADLRRPWTRERIARLAFMAGQGYSAKRIAADPEVHTTESNVYRQAHRFGIALGGTRSVLIAFRMPAGDLAVLEGRAERAGMAAAAYARRLVAAALTGHPLSEPGR